MLFPSDPHTLLRAALLYITKMGNTFDLIVHVEGSEIDGTKCFNVGTVPRVFRHFLLPPLNTTSPRQSLGTLEAQRL